MRALVISGGGSKGAFAGGVAQHLIEDKGRQYDIFIGSSTGSLLIPHLALNKIETIRKAYTSVNQNSIFNINPFIINGDDSKGWSIKINHLNVVSQFFKKKKTFGESLNLRKLIANTFTKEDFDLLKNSGKEIVVTVSNLTLNSIEYKSIKDYDYEEFCDWIWISCNVVPFMSLITKHDCEYADGGFGSMVPIEEAIQRGATVVDVIVLEMENKLIEQLPTKNVFSLLTNLNLYMMERVSKQNIRLGKFVANNSGAILNFYFTPTALTPNALIFNKKNMCQWWEMGIQYAKSKDPSCGEIRHGQ